MHISPGALHIHSHYSDGSGTIPDICAAAQAAGLEWMIVTDHDTLEGRRESGWHDQVLVVVDQEITPFHNHLLAFNLEQVISSNQSPQAFIDKVYNDGGFGIIAHPDEQQYNKYKGVHRWDDWNINMPTNSAGRSIGIELWNFMSDWGESLNNYNVLYHYFSPKSGLRGPTKATIEWWDALNMAGKRAFGVFGVDVHAFLRSTPIGRVQVFPYQMMFGTLTNYLWLPERLPGNYAAALRMVYGAIAQGRSYMVNRMEGDCPNVEFRAFRGSAQWYAGDIASLNEGPITIKVDLGIQAPVRLIHNGKIIMQTQRQLLMTVNERGVYRIESYKSKLPWMMSNPLYITQ